MNSALLAVLCFSPYLFPSCVSGSLLDSLIQVAQKNPPPTVPPQQQQQNLDSVSERKQSPEVVLILTATARCHGALISDKTILTAASCFKDESGNNNPDPATVRIGLNTQNQMIVNEKILVKSVTVNPSYRFLPDSGLHENDLAVIRLQTAAQIDGTTVSTINWAPPNNARPDANIKLKTISIVGWGANRDTLDGGDSDSLQKSDAVVMSQKKCAAVYTGVDLPSSVLCVNITQGIPSTCEDGDVGAILRFKDTKNKDQQLLLGIATKPILNACQDTLPSLFTNVASSAKWIKSLANAKN